MSKEHFHSVVEPREKLAVQSSAPGKGIVCNVHCNTRYLVALSYVDTVRLRDALTKIIEEHEV